MERAACRCSALVCPRPGILLCDRSRGCGWKTLLPDGTSVTNEFYQAVRLARELAASSSSRREPRRGTEGGPRLARMGRRRRVSHKEHKDRKEGGSRGACITGSMAPVPAFLPPPALCSLRSLWLTLSGFSIPPSIILPPSFCRRPLASPRTRAAPATRAETHPAGRSGWPRNLSTCSPFHPFRPRPPASHAPCRPPPSFPLTSEKSNGPISSSPARAILSPMCDPCASVPSRSQRPLAGSPARPSTNALPSAPPALHPTTRSHRARSSPLPVGQASRPAGSWGLRPQANLTDLHQIPASKDSPPLSFDPARSLDRRRATPSLQGKPRKTKENQTRDRPWLSLANPSLVTRWGGRRAPLRPLPSVASVPSVAEDLHGYGLASRIGRVPRSKPAPFPYSCPRSSCLQELQAARGERAAGVETRGTGRRNTGKWGT